MQSNFIFITVAFLQTHLLYVIVFSNTYRVLLHHDFILHFCYVVAVVWSVLTSVLARNLSHTKEGRGEGRKANSFSSSLSSGKMDAIVFADLDLSMSTDAKGSTDKLLWVLQSDSNKLVYWNNNFFLYQFFSLKQYITTKSGNTF